MGQSFLFALQMFDPRGRCNRKGLLIVAVAMLIAQIALGLILYFKLVDMNAPGVLALKIAFCWLAITAGAKRLHDLNLRAWWMLMVIVVTTTWSIAVVLGLVFTVGVRALDPASPWYAAALLASTLPVFAATLWLHFARGVAGPNRFGPEPDGIGFSSPLLARPVDGLAAA